MKVLLESWQVPLVITGVILIFLVGGVWWGLISFVAGSVLLGWKDRHKGPLKFICERCGDRGATPYGPNSTETTRDVTKVYRQFPLEKMYLCLSCLQAHDLLLQNMLMLHIGHTTQIEEARKMWGGDTERMLALIAVARRNIDSARRVLSKEEFARAKPWLENMLKNNGGEAAV